MPKNIKSEAFEKFLVDEQITCFDKRDIGDEDGTVVYRSYIQTDIGDMPIFVLLDATIYSVIRVLVGGGVVTDDNYNAIVDFINRENSVYKNFKYYVEKDDDSVYLDCIYISSNTAFEPQLLYVLMNQIVKYMPGVTAELKQVMNIDVLPNPFAAHEHHHTHDDAAMESEKQS